MHNGIPILVAVFTVLNATGVLWGAWEDVEFAARAKACVRILYIPPAEEAPADSSDFAEHRYRVEAVKSALSPITRYFETLPDFTISASTGSIRKTLPQTADKQFITLAHAICADKLILRHPDSQSHVFCALTGTTLEAVMADHSQSPFLAFLKKGLFEMAEFLINDSSYHDYLLNRILFHDTVQMSRDMLPLLASILDEETRERISASLRDLEQMFSTSETEEEMGDFEETP